MTQSHSPEVYLRDAKIGAQYSDQAVKLLSSFCMPLKRLKMSTEADFPSRRVEHMQSYTGLMISVSSWPARALASPNA